jgi:putative flippase GtrA
MEFQNLSREAARLFRFGLVGMCVTLVYALASTVANEIFGVPPVLAAIVGQTAAIGISYIGHSSFSFRVKADHSRFLWRYLAIVVLLTGIALGLTWLITDLAGFSFRIATAAVAVLIPIINYLCNRLWVFSAGLAPASR